VRARQPLRKQQNEERERELFPAAPGPNNDIASGALSLNFAALPKLLLAVWLAGGNSFVDAVEKVRGENN
jgi:hypothetical protein